MTTVRVAALDAGSVAQSNLGWSAFDAEPGADGTWQPTTLHGIRDRGTSLADLAACIHNGLHRGVPVALGVEAPCFVPIPDDESLLLSARAGEEGRAFAGGAGPAVMVPGIVESVWLFQRLAGRGVRATVDVASWPTPNELLLWEAFVSQGGKYGPDSKRRPSGWELPDDTADVRDAATAAAAFIDRGRPYMANSDITANGHPTFNVLAAAAMRCGMIHDSRELALPCYTVKAVAASK